MAAIETKVTAKAAPEMEYVTIPETDLFDMPVSGIWNNKDLYEPGTHLVPKEVAAHLKERLAVWQKEQIRQLRPNADPRVRASVFEK